MRYEPPYIRCPVHGKQEWRTVCRWCNYRTKDDLAVPVVTSLPANASATLMAEYRDGRILDKAQE